MILTLSLGLQAVIKVDFSIDYQLVNFSGVLGFKYTKLSKYGGVGEGQSVSFQS